MSYVVCIPSIYQPYTDRCVESLRLSPLHVVDNTVHNSGVAASWNSGIDAMHHYGAEWLIVCSAAMVFGDPGGQDFVDQLDLNHLMVSALDVKGPLHLTAFRSDLLDKVGRFDQNFWPGYWEDVDYYRRIELAYGEMPPTKYVFIDGYCRMVGHGVILGGASKDTEASAAYMLTKWGDVSRPLYPHPFNDARFSWKYWPSSPDGGRWYA